MGEGVSWAAAGQPAAAELLRREVRRGTLGQSWLLVGPPGVGQRELVVALAAATSCPHASDGEGCGTCGTCRRIAAGSHPDVVELVPEGAAHHVDAVRGWVALAARTPLEAPLRVLRVVDADRANEPAQNALLKALEEPAPHALWVLEAEDDGALLETVLSRCRRLDLRPWPLDALVGLAADAPHPRALARAANGSPQRLRVLLDEDLELVDPDRRAELSVAAARRRHLALVGELRARGPGVVVELVRRIEGWAQARVEVARARHQAELAELEDRLGGQWPAGLREQVRRRHRRQERQERTAAVELAVEQLGSYLRDVLLLAGGGPEDAVVNADVLPDLRRDAAELPESVVLDGLAAVEECVAALRANANVTLQLEQLLLRLAVGLWRAGAR